MPAERLNGVQLFYEMEGDGDTIVLTHGSWGDGLGWMPAIGEFSRNYRVITWDRRGHSRSEDGDSPGSQADDLADLVALIEHVADRPVHAVGNSYGAVISLNLMAQRPDLVRSVVAHEPPALPLLGTSSDPNGRAQLAALLPEMDIVRSLLESGKHREAASYFIDNVAFGPGSWEQMPEEPKLSMIRNAATFLDELRDPAVGAVDVPALAESSIPLLLTMGTESPEFFRLIVSEIVTQVPHARVETLQGAGHVPHFTHPVEWVSILTSFYDSIAS